MNMPFKVCLWGRALLPELGLACPQASCWKLWAPSTGWDGGGRVSLCTELPEHVSVCRQEASGDRN